MNEIQREIFLAAMDQVERSEDFYCHDVEDLLEIIHELDLKLIKRYQQSAYDKCDAVARGEM